MSYLFLLTWKIKCYLKFLLTLAMIACNRRWNVFRYRYLTTMSALLNTDDKYSFKVSSRPLVPYTNCPFGPSLILVFPIRLFPGYTLRCSLILSASDVICHIFVLLNCFKCPLTHPVCLLCLSYFQFSLPHYLFHPGIFGVVVPCTHKWHIGLAHSLFCF